MTEVVNYIMDPDGTPRECVDIDEWSAFFNDLSRRQIAVDELPGMKLSTVFLGTDHNWNGSGYGDPILFETMWFISDKHVNDDLARVDEMQERYCTIKQARAGHARWLRRAQVFTGEHGAKLRDACVSCWDQGGDWSAVDALIDTAGVL